MKVPSFLKNTKQYSDGSQHWGRWFPRLTKSSDLLSVYFPRQILVSVTESVQDCAVDMHWIHKTKELYYELEILSSIFIFIFL